MSTQSLRRLLYGSVAMSFTACAIAWLYLPVRTPLHFGFNGRVTSWTQSSPVLWFLMPVLGVGLLALVRAASGPPEAWNLPSEDVKRFRALPADAQMQIREIAERSLLITLMLFVVTLVSLQVGVFATAIRQADRMPIYAAAGMILPVIAAIVVGSLGQRRLRSQIRMAAAQHNEPASSA